MELAWHIRCSGSLEYGIAQKLCNTKAALKKWNRVVFGHIQTAIRELSLQIMVAQHSPPFDYSLHLIRELKVALDIHQKWEESLWRQKFCVAWLNCQELNTKFFHASMIIHWCRNQVLQLKDSLGSWVGGRPTVGNLLLHHFQAIYTFVAMVFPSDLDQLIPPSVSVDDNESLLAMPSSSEVFDAMFSMNPHKSPGLDRMTRVFLSLVGPLLGLILLPWCKGSLF